MKMPNCLQTGSNSGLLKKGKAINDFSQMEPGDRAFHFCFHNDYKDVPVTVTVKSRPS